MKKVMHNKMFIWAIVTIVLMGCSYFAGTKHATAARTAGFQRMTGQGQFPGGNRSGAGVTRGMGAVIGKVIAKDDSSITVELRSFGQGGQGSGGSKIVFYSDKTAFTKSISGLAEDVAVGSEVTITGTQNSDGSYTASSVQLRPENTPVR